EPPGPPRRYRDLSGSDQEDGAEQQAEGVWPDRRYRDHVERDRSRDQRCGKPQPPHRRVQDQTRRVHRDRSLCEPRDRRVEVEFASRSASREFASRKSRSARLTLTGYLACGRWPEPFTTTSLACIKSARSIEFSSGTTSSRSPCTISTEHRTASMC